MEFITLSQEPQLDSPSLVAAWPGMGGVAAIATRYIKDGLGAEEFGAIEPHRFFDPSVVEVKDGQVQEIVFPQSRFHFWKSGTGHDLIILTAEAQPTAGGYVYAGEVLDLAEKFGVKRIYTTAASPAHVYYAKKPRVLGVATGPDLAKEMAERGARPMREGSITGMNGLLLGVARKRGMEGICLLGEMPIYMTQVANPRAARAVIEVLSRFLNITLDMNEMDQWVGKMDDEIEKNIFQLMASYGDEAQKLVDYFDHLKEQAGGEEEETEPEGLGEVSNEDLLREVEKFLKRQRRGTDEERG